MIRVGSNETFTGGNEAGNGAFHVGSATTVEHAVLDHGTEGMVQPLLFRAAGNHIGMSGKAEQWAAVATTQPEVIHLTEAHRLSAKAERGKSLRKQRLATGIVRGNRATAD